MRLPAAPLCAAAVVAIASMTVLCAAAQQMPRPNQSSSQQLNNEAKKVRDQKATLDQQLKDLQDTAASLQTSAAKQLAQSQADELRAQSQALGKISDKYQEIIDVNTLLPKLSGRTKETALETLGRLNQELAELQAGRVVPQANPPADNNKLPNPTTGSLVGSIRDEDGNVIQGAVVLVRCGDKGNYYDAPTRSDLNGQYVFSNLPADKDCLVKAAKPPSDGDKAYEERTLKPLHITAGRTRVATGLQLEERRASLGEFARSIVGFEQTGASASASAQKFFFDLSVSIPSPFHRGTGLDPNFGSFFRYWGDVRVSSVPQQITSSLGDFAVRFPEQVSAVKVNEVAQSAEFLAGGELRLKGWGFRRSRLLSFERNIKERFGMYLVGGGGISTPINPRDTLQVFAVPPLGSVPAFDKEIQNLGLTSQLAGKSFIAFASQDRDKFYRRYYAGFRLKTFYYERDTDEPLRRFPATLDVLTGQNEAVAGGRLQRMVLRLEGFYSLPFTEANYIYLFGTAEMIPGRPQISDAIILQSAPANTPVPASNVLLISTPQLSRDQYRLGIGIDAISLIQHIKDRNLNNPTGNQHGPSKPKQ
jgi:hypothetical protein